MAFSDTKAAIIAALEEQIDRLYNEGKPLGNLLEDWGNLNVDAGGGDGGSGGLTEPVDVNILSSANPVEVEVTAANQPLDVDITNASLNVNITNEPVEVDITQTLTTVATSPTQSFTFSIPNGQQESGWISIEYTQLSKLITLVTPAEVAANTIITFTSRPLGGGLETPVIDDQDDSNLFALRASGPASFGAGAMSRLSSEVGREWKINVSEAVTGAADFEIRIS